MTASSGTRVARTCSRRQIHWVCRVAQPAGLFGWVDAGVDTDALAQRMLDLGYLLAPGSLFHARREPSTLMRINFATARAARFWRDFVKVRSAL